VKKKGRASPLSKIALAATSGALTLLALEVVARVERKLREPGKEAQETAIYHEFDPVLGWRLKPGARVTYRRREYTVEVAINSHGLRDRERSYEAPAGTLRLLALGDSFIEAYTVPLEQTVTQVLETSLANQSGCAVEALNGAVAGYSTDQEYLFYLSEGVRYSPQIVLLFFYYNDIHYNNHFSYYGLPKPIFQVMADGLKLHPPRPLLKDQEKEEPAAEEEATESDEPHSALLAFVEERLRQGAPQLHNRLAHWGFWEPLEVRPPHDTLRVYEQRTHAFIEEAWWRTAEILKALAQEVSSRKARLVVVYVPSRMEVRDRSWEATRFVHGLDARWDRRLVATRLTQAARSVGFPVLDLTPALRETEESFRGSAYFTYDGHWTPAGHRAAAGAIADFLIANGWMGKPPSCQAPPL
jgi:hypothetical protein